MKNIIIIFTLLSSFSVFSQGKAAYTTEQFFLDKEGKKVAEKDESYFTQTNYYQANKIMTDVNLTANRMPVEYREHLVIDNDTIPNGPWIKWYENTKKQYEKKYANGVLVGKLDTYYENGKQKRSEEYDNEGKLIDGKCFDEEGLIITCDPYKTLPKFTESSLTEYFKKEIKKPKRAKKESGTVEVMVTIAEDGTIDNSKVLSSPNKYFSEEAERVICAMPPWEAGKIEGIATKMDIKVAVLFE